MSSPNIGWPADICEVRLSSFLRLKSFPYLLVGAISLAYLIPFVRILTWSPDEGTFLYDARIILGGALPGRDFLELNGPGTFYWLALFFKLFGASVLTARLLLLFTGMLTALFVLCLSRQIGATGIFATAFVLVFDVPLMVMNNPHHDATLFGLLAVCAFMAAERRFASEPVHCRKAFLLVFAAGVLLGCTSCFIQQKGFYLAAALLVSILILHPGRRLRLTVIFGAGFSSVLAIECLLFGLAGALPGIIYNNYILPLRMYGDVNAVPYGFPLWSSWIPGWFHAFRSTLPAFLAGPAALALSIPFLAMVAAPALPIAGLAWRKIAFRRQLMPIWLAAYAWLASEIHRSDITHLRNGALILIVLFFALCEKHAKPYPKRIAMVITGCALLHAAVYLAGTAPSSTILQTRRGTLLAQHSDAALDFLISHTRPGEYAFVYPFHPIYYFLADVRNPTHWSVMIYTPGGFGAFRQAVRDIDTKKVRYVLWDTFSGDRLKGLFPAYRHPPPEELVMEPYLRSHYHQVAFENGFHILERNP